MYVKTELSDQSNHVEMHIYIDNMRKFYIAPSESLITMIRDSVQPAKAESALPLFRDTDRHKHIFILLTVSIFAVFCV